MKFLVDTNILTRSAEPGDPLYKPATDALATIRAQGHSLCLVPQNLYEFWVVMTRPQVVNGLGKTAVEAAHELAAVQALFPILDDTPALYPEWERLVIASGVVGKNAHDARLVASRSVHGLSHLLTFNGPDFRRFPNITVIDPIGVGPPPTPSP